MRRLWLPGVSTAAMLVVLVLLGNWQVQRLAWKTDILATIARAEAAPGVPLTDDPPAYAKVRVAGRFRDDLAALYASEGHDTPRGPVLGAQLIVPLERAGLATVLVDRGWVPGTRPYPASPVAGVVEGYVAPAETARFFSVPDDLAGRHFFTLDPRAIGMALGLDRVAPFTVVALGQAGASGGEPEPAQTMPRPPNNHLDYAITWYGLAAALLVIFLLYARRQLVRVR